MGLYEERNGPDASLFGTDSLALDIMRSRDHGLPGYVHYLNRCSDSGGTGQHYKTWKDLEAVINPQVME